MLMANDVNAAKRRIQELMTARAAKPTAEDEPLVISAQVSRELTRLVRDTLDGQGRGAQTALVNDALAQYFGATAGVPDESGRASAATLKVKIHPTLAPKLKRAGDANTVINEALAEYFDIEIEK